MPNHCISKSLFKKDITKILNTNFCNIFFKQALRTIWNAIMYLVKTGCQWRMLSGDFLKWQLVYYYYSKWANPEDFDLLLSKLREEVITKRNQNKVPSLG
ncbi:transposase, partial [Capnocytophaga canimorsus]|uniref:transposase n=1 Tax=Capnocytophaga canimorsus TaxID=28188 RepID=UPI00385E3647